MNRMKAISPIIATIIILLVTIAIAGAGYSYISTYWSGLVGKQIEVINAFCTGDGQAKVMIKNIGTNPVRTGEITIINPNTGEDLTQDVSWSPSVSDPNLVLELKFEEGSGTTAKDTSGQGNDGTLINGPQWVDGKIGKAMSFDGTNDYVSVPNVNIATGAPFILCAWVKPEATGDYRAIMGYDSSHRILIATNGQMLSQQDGDFFSAGAGDVPNAVWTHVTYWNDGTKERWYINGVQSGSDHTTSNAEWDSAFYLGFYGDVIWYRYNGLIDEVRVYNRAISGDEIKALYENSVLVQPGDTATLTHTCTGRCRYNLVLGGAAKEAMVEC